MKRLISEVCAYLLYPFTAIGLLLLANVEYHLWKSLDPLGAILGTVFVAIVVLAYIFVMSTLPIQTALVALTKQVVRQIVWRIQRVRDYVYRAVHK